MNLPNTLSLLRIPLAFLFLIPSTYLRVFSLLSALLTDGLDGFIARRYHQKTKLGTVLDPITDKLFVATAFLTMIFEGRLEIWQAVSLMARDIALLCFGFYLLLSKQWSSYAFRAIWCGKISTVLQFAVLLLLTVNSPVPFVFYLAFILLGALALLELYLTRSVKA